LLFIGSKCAILKQATSCHDKCEPLDHKCHHACPRLIGSWLVGDVKDQTYHV
jgi:hypothetical protein